MSKAKEKKEEEVEEEWAPKPLMNYQLYAEDFYMRTGGDPSQITSE